MAKLSLIQKTASAVCACLALAACSSDAPFVGSWIADSPVDITAGIPGSLQSTSTIGLDFKEHQQKGTGTMEMTFDLKVAEPVMVPDATGQIVIPAKASIEGTWTYDVDEQDDVLIHFNESTIKVDIDTTAVKYVGIHPAKADSLLAPVMASVRAKAKHYVISELARFTVINDISVSTDGSSMALEVSNPDADMRFKRVDH